MMTTKEPNTMYLFVRVAWLLVLMGDGRALLQRHQRHCCKYSYEKSPASLCRDTAGCVVSLSDALTSPTLEACRVLGDSKKDISTQVSRETCLRKVFVDQSSNDPDRSSISGLFELRRYIMEADQPQNEFQSLEVILPASRDWYSVRFRIIDLELCPNAEMTPSCAPRCVDIERKNLELLSNNESAKIVYDCEGGFYVSDTDSKSILSTRDHSYQFDICFDSISDGKACKSYLFEMGGIREEIVLVEKSPLIEKRQVVLQMSESFKRYLNVENGTSTLEIYRISDYQGQERAANELVQFFNIEEGFDNQVYEMRSLKDGDYMISILSQESDRIYVTKFQLNYESDGKEAEGMSAGLISFLVILIVVGILLGLLYRRYRLVQQSHHVCPHRLLESGRIKPKDVFIITNVDNRHHINIVMDFGKYLKAHCAVGEVYFALDSETGITSQANHDPWKWAQSVAEKMADSGCLIFIGAPPEHVGISIYKDLPNNQAFISTLYLKKMSDENRVAVILFPYSDPETLPNLIPPHLKNRPYNLPTDMNSFLCQLLEVRKRELCTCVPVQIVHPEILPSAFSEFKGGKELLDNITSLTAKVDLLKVEYQREKNGGGNTSTISRVFDDLEIKQLLRPESRKKAMKNGSSPGLQVELEKNLYSIKDKQFEDRDKSTHPELETA